MIGARTLPEAGVRIDPTHPLAVDLLACILPQEGHGRLLRNLVSGQTLSGTGTAAWKAGTLGRRLGNQSSWMVPAFELNAGAQEVCSLTMVAFLESTPGNWLLWSTILADDGTGLLYLQNNDGSGGTKVFARATSATSAANTDQIVFGLGELLVLTATLSSDRKVRLYSRGKLVGTSPALTGTAKRPKTVAPGGTIALAAGPATWEAVLVHGRALSANDVALLHAAPLDLLAE